MRMEEALRQRSSAALRNNSRHAAQRGAAERSQILRGDMYPTDTHSEEETTGAAFDYVVTPDVSEHQSAMHFLTTLTSTDTILENPLAHDCPGGAGLGAEAGPGGALAVNHTTIHALLSSPLPDADATSTHLYGSSWATTTSQENNFCWSSDAEAGSSAVGSVDTDGWGLTSDSDTGGSILNNTDGNIYRLTVVNSEPTPTCLPAMKASPPTRSMPVATEIIYPPAVAVAEEATSVSKERGSGETLRMPHFTPHAIDLRIRTYNSQHSQQPQNQLFAHTELPHHTHSYHTQSIHHNRQVHNQRHYNHQHHQTQPMFAPTSAYQSAHSPHVPLSSRTMSEAATTVYAFNDGASKFWALGGAGANANVNFLQGWPLAQSWCPSANGAVRSGEKHAELYGALGTPPSAALGAPVANDAHVHAHAHAHLHTHALASPSGGMGDLVLSQLDATSHPQDYGKLQRMDSRLEQSANCLGNGSHTYCMGELSQIAAPGPGLAHAHFHEHVHVHVPAQVPASTSTSASGWSSRSRKNTTKGESGARGRAHIAGGGNGGGVGGGFGAEAGDSGSGGGGGRSGGDGGGGGARKKVRKHFCSICEKGFADNYSLRAHVRTHTGEKPFPCLKCQKRFRQKAHLAKHHQTHSGKKTGV